MFPDAPGTLTVITLLDRFVAETVVIPFALILPLSAAVARAPCEVDENDHDDHKHQTCDPHQARRGDSA